MQRIRPVRFKRGMRPKVQNPAKAQKLPWYRPKSDKSLEPNYDLMLGEE